MNYISEGNINIGNLIVNTDFIFIFWATDLINTGDYTIDFYEVNLGTANTRSQQDHILRNHEQQIMDQHGYIPQENGNMNKNRPEAERKKTRNIAEIEEHKAGFAGESETRKYQGGSLCNG